MAVFKTRYLSDEEIFSKINEILEECNQIQWELADPETCRSQDRLAWLGRRLQELSGFCNLVEEFRKCLEDRRELKEIVAGDVAGSDLSILYEECIQECEIKTDQIYKWLAERGFLENEFEDETDLKILSFIDYAGPEYAWRLSINVGISYEESRRRLSGLIEKGLLERVEGNMLDNYHRAKSWIKHMNHTYYRISREGRLYLRNLRRDSQL